ncbi:MAG: hypothetical protein NTZ78_10380 [Candidatus Aureabacteria bacterium]|nr:hypothetical protein [Candidatus Auribacterota bacterium]
MKPDDRYGTYEDWEDDSERIEKIRKPPKGKGVTPRGPEPSSPRGFSLKKNRQYRRPDKF